MKSITHKLISQVLEDDKKQKSPQPKIISRHGDLVLYKAVDAKMIQLLSQGISFKSRNQSGWQTCNLGFAYEYAVRGPVYFVYKKGKPYVFVSFAAREMKDTYQSFPSEETIEKIRPLFSDRRKFPLRIINRIPELLEYLRPKVVSRRGSLVLYKTAHALVIQLLSRGIFSKKKDQSGWFSRYRGFARSYANIGPIYFVYKNDKPYVFVSFATKEMKDICTSFPSLKIVREIRPLFSNRQEFPLEIMNQIPELLEDLRPETVSRRGGLVLYKAVDALTVRWLSRGIFCRYENQSHWRTCELGYAFVYARKGPVYFVYKNDKPYVFVSFAAREMKDTHQSFPSAEIIQEIRPLFLDKQEFPHEVLERLPKLIVEKLRDSNQQPRWSMQNYLRRLDKFGKCRGGRISR